MKLKPGQRIYQLLENTIRTGEGSLAGFLSIPHVGVNVGNRTLLRILYPASLSKKMVEMNTQYLLAIYGRKCRLAQGRSKKYSDDKFYREVHFNVDGRGKIAYISVPTKWMRVVEEATRK